MKEAATKAGKYWPVPALLLVLFFGHAGPTTTEASSPQQVSNVNVVNAAANPVPTLAQGTTAVSGTVAAAQSGAWNVGVSGTVGIDPLNNSVAIAGQPTVGIDPGNNTVTLSRQPENPARGRVSAVTFLGLLDGGTALTQPAYDVPANKILVIEYASFTCTGLPAGQTATAAVAVLTNGFGAYHQLTNQATPPGGTVAAGQQVRLYADPSSPVYANVIRTGGASGNVSCYFTMSGHLVDAS